MARQKGRRESTGLSWWEPGIIFVLLFGIMFIVAWPVALLGVLFFGTGMVLKRYQNAKLQASVVTQAHTVTHANRIHLRLVAYELLTANTHLDHTEAEHLAGKMTDVFLKDLRDHGTIFVADRLPNSL